MCESLQQFGVPLSQKREQAAHFLVSENKVHMHYTVCLRP